MYLAILIAAFCSGSIYLWLIHRAVNGTPAEAAQIVQPPWTDRQLQDAYQRAQSHPIDTKPFLFKKKNRRYVVTGGSGHVGGWIVQHLLMRGEDPAAIRIIDLRAPRRSDNLKYNLSFKATDVSDANAVLEAFQAPWPETVQSLPLTVFHCVAYINCFERGKEFFSMYDKVNIKGTENVLRAAQRAGASILVLTSSASIYIIPPSFFPWPKDRWQVIPNARGEDFNRPINEFSSNYHFSKARADQIVLQANNPSAGFLTGSIQPGLTLHGGGGANEWSFSWDCLRRGGSPTWLRNFVINFVDAQNVSIGHLAYENALLDPNGGSLRGGKGYVVTDPGPPVRYSHVYDGVSRLAHPLTPAPFPPVSIIILLLPSYLFEAYRRLRVRIPFLDRLPDLKGDAAKVVPPMFYTSSLHTLIVDTKAQEEIGYKAPISTIDGLAMTVLEWNNKVEEDRKKKIGAGKAAEVKIQSPGVFPKGV